MRRSLSVVLGFLLAAALASADFISNPPSGTATDIASGTTTITGGADKSVCFDDAGVINCADADFQWNKTANQLIFGSDTYLSRGVLANNFVVGLPQGAVPNIIRAGNSTSASDAGSSLTIIGGNGLTNTTGGLVALVGGPSGSVAGVGGAAQVTGGAGGGSGVAGAAVITGGAGGGTGAGGDVTIDGGASLSSTVGNVRLAGTRGQTIVGGLGIEWSESDTNPTCAAGNYTIYADTSEAKLKKCQNGTATDLSTSTPPGGSSGNLQTNDGAGAFGAYAGTGACGAGTAVTALSASGAASCTAFGSGTVTGTGTTGLIPDWTSATALGDSAAYRISVANDGSTGTTTNKLVKFTSAGAAVITAAAETSGILGVVKSGAGTTGSAVVTLMGGASCVFDNATTAGHYATVSASVAGDCSDTGAATFPVAGTQVLGIITETGIAGTRTLFMATPDVASASQGNGGGGNKNPAGAAGDVQYRASSNAFAAEAAFNYDATNNRLARTSATSATDATAFMDSITGTMPAVPTTTDYGLKYAITGAGSASQVTAARRLDYLAGYTGSSLNVADIVSNANAGTGATLNVGGSAGLGSANAASYSVTSATTAGSNVGGTGIAQNSTADNLGYWGHAGGTAAGTNVGVLGDAVGSTEGTGPKNIGVMGTLTTTSPSAYTSLNGSFAGFFDGGTLPDATSRVIQAQGTLPSSPSATAGGIQFSITGAGSTGQVQRAMFTGLLAGYTGASGTSGAQFLNQSAGTGTTLNINASSGLPSDVNYGAVAMAVATTTGTEVGVAGGAQNSTGINIGLQGAASGTAAGTQIGVLGGAGGSTEGTDFKSIGGYFTLGTSIIASSNINVALVADNAAVASPIFNAYDNGTLVFSITDGGPVTMTSTLTSSATGAFGWSVVAGANTACNTTCTSACVVGFASAVSGSDPVACTDASADSCLCAGSS